MPKRADITLDYIKSRCEVCEISGCWHWLSDAKTTRRKHPQMHVSDHPAGPRPVLVRRLAYEAYYDRPLMANLDENAPGYRYIVRNERKCHSDDCVNPQHLKSMTKMEKVRSSLKAANSHVLKKQIANAMARRKYAKLTKELVEEIRLMPRTGPDRVSDTALTRMLAERGVRVCRKAVSEARNGTTWRTYGSVFNLLPGATALMREAA